MDLYARLEELRGMTRLLIDDVGRLKPLVGDGNVLRRRSLCRLVRNSQVSGGVD